LGWHSGSASHLGTLVQGCKKLAVWRVVGSRGHHNLFTQRHLQEAILGKPTLEDLQLRLPGYKRDAPKILKLISHSTKGQLSSYPFPLSLFPPASIGNSSWEASCWGGGVNGFFPFPCFSLFPLASIEEVNIFTWVYP
jgi:hypothetical protein